jgi:hypothetical protein
MVARGDAYGHPIDVSSMESVRNTLGLVPVENDEVS